MKTAELTGSRLDYWVAKAEGIAGEIGDGHWFVTDNGALFRPSSEWATGGPIIEREGIELTRREVMPSLFEWVGSTMHGFEQMGATHLVAAMRAYVASKFGDTVPEEQA